MLSILLEYSTSVYNFKASAEHIEYDEELDNIESLIMDICEFLSDTQLVRFKVSGFGESAWPVDVGTDMAVIIPQVPEVINALYKSEDTSISFYEQGIERELLFSPHNSSVKVSCKDLAGKKTVPINEIIDLSEILEMLFKFFNSFISLSKNTCPDITHHKIFQDWLKHSFVTWKDTELNHVA